MDEVKTFIENYDSDSMVSDCTYIHVDDFEISKNNEETLKLIVSKLEEISKIEITAKYIETEYDDWPSVDFKLKNSNKTGIIRLVYDRRSYLYWFVEIVA
jgi:hypothetical protein